MAAKARQNERECDVSVVSGLFMALLVTAVAFVAVKFRWLWFPRETRSRNWQEKKKTTTFGVKSGEMDEKEKKNWRKDKEVNTEKKIAMKILYVCATVWNYSRDGRFQCYLYLCRFSTGIVRISFNLEYRVTYNYLENSFRHLVRGSGRNNTRDMLLKMQY